MRKSWSQINEVFLCFAFVGVGLNATLGADLAQPAYSHRFIAWQVRSPAMNNKGQVAGIENKGTERVLHIWLPAADYGLTAGAHAFPIPIQIGNIQLIDFSDNGGMLLGWPGTATLTLYFSVSEGVFHHLPTLLDLPQHDLASVNPFNMSPDGTIYGRDPNIEGPGFFRYNPGSGLLSFYHPPDSADSSGGVSVHLWAGNSVGDQLAGQITGGGPAPWPYQSGLWRDGTFLPLPIPEGVGLIDINDKGEVVGGTLIPGTPGGAFVEDLVIYLPAGGYGLSAGVHLLDYPVTVRNLLELRLSGHGEVHTSDAYNLTYDSGVGGPEFYSVALGRTVDLNASLISGADVVVNKIRRINDAGVILATGLNGAGTPGLLILSPAITARVKAEPERVEIDDLIILTVTIENQTDEPFVPAGVLGGTLVISGSGAVQQLNNPLAINPLQPGQTGTQTFYFLAKQLGQVRFSIQAVGFHADASQWLTPEIQSGPVKISSKGDLLIKRQDEPETFFALDDSYQESPALRQAREEFIKTTEPTVFDLKIENDGKRPASFFLKALEMDTEDNWLTTYTFQGADLKSAVLSAEGWETPQLAPGASIRLETGLESVAEPGELTAVIQLWITAQSSDLTAIDSISIAATTRDVIVVNVTSDDPDADPDDGVIDVDLDEEGEQISLRAAIDFANRRPGKDRIEFDIPGGGVPTISPFADPEETLIFPSDSFFGLEFVAPFGGKVGASLTVTDPIVIDGTTQPGGLVELKGQLIGTDSLSGLVLAGGNSELKGMVINRHMGFGLILMGDGGDWVRDCIIGTDPSMSFFIGNGTEDVYIDVRSGRYAFHNSFWGGGLLVTSPGNLISGNVILANAPPIFAPFRNDDPSSVGGNVLVKGPNAVGNRFIANYIGVNPNGGKPPSNFPFHEDYGLSIQDAPATQVGDGTAAAMNRLASVSINNGRATVIGNEIGLFRETGEPLASTAVYIRRSTGVEVRGNVINGSLNGVNMAGSADVRVVSNFIGINPDTGTLFGEAPGDLPLFGLVFGADSIGQVGGSTAAEANHIGFEANAFADVSFGDAKVTIEGNRFLGSALSPIDRAVYDLINDGPDVNDAVDSDGKQNYPVLGVPVLANGRLVLSGSLSTRLGGRNYSISLFRVSRPLASGHGGSDLRFIGSAVATVDSSGTGGFEFVMDVNGLIGVGEQICATATWPGNQTSEFSLNRTVGDGVDTDGDGVSDAEEALVGDGNMDGVPDALQAEVVSIKTVTGPLGSFALAPGASPRVQLASGSALSLRNVSADGASDAGAPMGYEYPLGVLRFEMWGMNPGDSGQICFTSAAPIGNIDLLWLARAGASGPLWDSLDLTGPTGPLCVSATDGGEHDRDGMINGRIQLVVAPARIKPPSPEPVLWIESTGVEPAIAWPVSMPLALLEYSPDLQPGSWAVVDTQPRRISNRFEIPLSSLRLEITESAYFRLQVPFP